MALAPIPFGSKPLAPIPFGSAPIRPVQQQGDFKYPVQESSTQRANKIAQYQQEAKQAQAESDRANSWGGKLGNFFKAAGGIVAGSEVGLGQSIAKIANVDSASTQAMQQAQQNNESTKVDLIKKIREKRAKGEDTTKFQQLYNELAKPGELDALLKETQNLPTTGQVAGQLGGTALDVLTAGTYGKAAQGMQSGRLAVQGGASALLAKTGIPSTVLPPAGSVVRGAVSAVSPELGKIAEQKASGLFTAKGAGNVIKGAGIGYGYDVTQGLQGARGEGRTGENAFIPGVGTAIGGGLPALSETVQSFKNKFSAEGKMAKTSGKRMNVFNTLEKDNAPMRRAFEAADRKGVDVKKILSETNLLNGAVDSNGTISTKNALENFDEVMAPFEGEVRKTIADEGAVVSVDTLMNRMEKGLQDSRLSGGARKTLQNNLDNEIQGLAMQADKSGNIPLTAVHDSKVFIGSHQNYTDTGANAVNKDVTRILKEIVEENTKTLDVDAYNKGLSERYALRDVLEALNGKKVEGGRLGKHFSSVVGGVVGSHFGPLGAIAGAETGRALKGVQMSGALGGDIQEGIGATSGMLDALANKKAITPRERIPSVVIPRKTSAVPDVVLPTSGKPPQSKNVGNLKITQATTIAPTKKTMPTTIPPKSTKGLGTMIEAAKANLKDPKMRQGGYIANPLGKAGAKSESVSSVKSSMTAETKSNLVRIIDDYHLKGGKNLELQQDAARIAEDHRWPMPKTYGRLIAVLQKKLDASN